jgi:hypothetical protein
MPNGAPKLLNVMEGETHSDPAQLAVDQYPAKNREAK